MNSTLLSKTCSFQASFEGTRAEVKLMPAADVHKLESIALPPIKTQKTHITPPRTSVPTIAQDNTGTGIGIYRIIFILNTQAKFHPDLTFRHRASSI